MKRYIFLFFCILNLACVIAAGGVPQPVKAENVVDSMAFFAGKVVQAYSQGKPAIEAKDLASYIDRAGKTIKSVTGELNWDYGKGILKIDTPKSQGVVGFLGKAGAVALGNVIVECKTEYASILAVSLDGKPLSDSEKILIQASTEEIPYGREVVKGQIVKMGNYPVNVLELNAQVTLKGCTKVKKISILDENGYVIKKAGAPEKSGKIQIKLPKDSMYVIASAADLPQQKSTKQKTASCWWEGENYYETNAPGPGGLQASYYVKSPEILSGGNWFSSDLRRGKDEIYVKYQVYAPEDGEYFIWCRKFWKHGPFRWRFDKQEWQTIGQDIALLDSADLQQYIGVNWVSMGKVKLAKGNHMLEIVLLTKEGEQMTFAFDCFYMSKMPVPPYMKYKPGEKTKLEEPGYWSFEPGFDAFNQSPIDLRYLNEKEAGINGFIRRDGSRVTLGDGTPVRFWAVNAGGDIVRNDKAAIDYFARHLSKHGVNMVRVHGGLADGAGNDLSKVNQAYLDKLHYFIAQMKKEGIYVNISFYFPLWIQMKSDYGIEGYDIGNKNPWVLLMIDEKFQEIYKTWLRILLTTKNPYTGIPLAQEPAVGIIEIQNEDSFFFGTFSRDTIPKVQMGKLDAMFGAWLANKYGSVEKAAAHWGSGAYQYGDKPAEGIAIVLDAFNMSAQGSGAGDKRKRMSDQVQFLVEFQKKFYHKMASFIRDELGSKSMISCSNWTTVDPKTLDCLERYTYTAGDIIDRHAAYFSGKHEGRHTSYAVEEGDVFKDRSALLEPEASVVQIFNIDNYPYMISETGWTNPNRFKGESVPMWAAYGALEGLDAVCFFAAGNVTWETGCPKFALLTPPIFGQFPGFALLFRRGDIREAEIVLKVTHSLPELYNFKGSPIYETQALDELRKMKK
ncbi:MAG: hypothetical protein ACM3WV_01815 [Bacillota bacterium]